MSDAHRRIFLKPDGLNDTDRTSLAEQLNAAIAFQQRLAAESPHVLQLNGSLQEQDDYFYVEHEPATGLPFTISYDPDSPHPPDDELLRLAAALIDSLRVAHDRSRNKPGIHGGLCPGTILETPDKLIKVTDFGLARAVGSVLGTESYVNLALAVPTIVDENNPITGTWEILSPDEFERTDRLCGYVDPEKYGSQTLNAFEATSDIIAAGFLLHIFAEFRHPYLEDPEFLNNPVLAESMAASLYNLARRKSLRDSNDPKILRWCEQVAAMLDRLPKNRPTAGDLATGLAEVGVKPADASTLLEGQLSGLDELAERGAWQQLQTTASVIVENEAATPAIIEKASSYSKRADTALAVAEAAKWLSGDEWAEAEKVFERIGDTTSLPPALAEQAAQLAVTLKASIAARNELAAIEQLLTADPAADPAVAEQELADLQRKLDSIATEHAVAPLLDRKNHAAEAIAARETDLAATLANLSAAKEWLSQLESAYQGEQWDEAQAILDTRPDIGDWPKSITDKAAKLEKSLAARNAIVPWITELRNAVEAEGWGEAGKIGKSRPEIGDWPTSLETEATALLKQVANAEQADAWITQVRDAVAASDWKSAARILSTKPSLDHWPDTIVKEEEQFRATIEQHAADEDKARMWLKRAKDAAGKQNYQEALDLLEKPPAAADRIPATILEEVEQCQQAYQSELQRQRRQAVAEIGSEFVRRLLADRLAGLVEPKYLSATAENVEFEARGASLAGKANLDITLRGAPGCDDRSIATCPIAFEISSDSAGIVDTDGTVAETITQKISQWCQGVQTKAIAEFNKRLQGGPFAKAETTASIDTAKRSVAATVHLLGAESSDGTLQVELQWNASALTWQLVDGTAFAKDAIDAVVRSVQASARPALVSQSPLLQQYASAIGVSVRAASEPNPDLLAAPIALSAELTFKPGPQSQATPFANIPLTCPRIGEVAAETGTQAAEPALRQLLVDLQRRSRVAVAKTVRAQVHDCPANIKVTELPKDIKDLTEEIQFTLKPRRGRPVPIAAVWNVASFEYQPNDEWESLLEGIQTLPPPPPPPPVPRAAVAAVIVAIIGGAVWMMVSGNTGETKPADKPSITDVATRTPDSQPVATDDNGNDNVAVAVTPVLPPPPSLDGAVAEVKALLGASSALRDHVDALVAPNMDGNPGVQYTIPGLMDAPIKIEPRRNSEGDYVLTDGHTSRIRSDVAKLDALLGLEDETAFASIDEFFASLVQDIGFADFVPVARLHWTPNRVPNDWSLGSDSKTWRTGSVPGQLLLAATEGDAPPLQIPFAVELVASQGSIESDADTQQLARQLEPEIRGAVLDRQRESFAQRRTDMLQAVSSRAADPDSWSVTPSEPPVGPEPARAIQLSVKSPTLTPRALDMTWNNDTLKFEFPPEWQDEIDRARIANDTLAQLAQLVPQSAPFNQTTLTDWREVSPPNANGQWKIATTTDWENCQGGGRGSLEFTVAFAADDAQLADSILDNDLRNLAAFTVLSEYAHLGESANRFFLADDEQRRNQFLADLASIDEQGRFSQRTMPVWHATKLLRPAMVLNRATTCWMTSAQGVALSVEFDGGWELDREHESLTGTLGTTGIATMSEAIASLATTATTRPQCTIAVASDGRLTVSWKQGNEFAALLASSAERLNLLTSQLVSLKDRKTLDQRLDALLAASDGAYSLTVSEADAFDLLSDIWRAKGIAPPEASSLSGLVAELRAYFAPPDSLSGKAADIPATVLAEYFVGPANTYAIVWSAASTDTSTKEGPTLLRLCDRAMGVDSGGSADTTTLGRLLLGQILDETEDAVKVNLLKGFEGKLGILLAPDTLMARIDFTGLPVEERMSRLSPVQSGLATKPLRWQSLADMERGTLDNYLCGFELCESLATPGRPPAQSSANEALRWALNTLESAFSATD